MIAARVVRRSLHHVAAHVDPSAFVHESARLAPGAMVLAGAHVGARCELRAGSIVGPGSRLGEDTVLGLHASVENCSIGSRCVLHSGVRIGADGFGFTIDASGDVHKKPQLLRVLLGDDVEVGAGSCIDRGSWRDTHVDDQTKIDNLVQVGHNVLIGRGSLICAHSALGGSSQIGANCIMGGRSAIADHVVVCSRVRLAAGSGVTKDITIPGDYAGFPAQPAADWRHEVVAVRAVSADLRRRRAMKGEGREAEAPPHIIEQVAGLGSI